jgi:hypothetical protein
VFSAVAAGTGRLLHVACGDWGADASGGAATRTARPARGRPADAPRQLACRSRRSRQLEQSAARLATRLARLRPGVRWPGLFGLAVVSWLLDSVNLTAVIVAVGLGCRQEWPRSTFWSRRPASRSRSSRVVPAWRRPVCRGRRSWRCGRYQPAGPVAARSGDLWRVDPHQPEEHHRAVSTVSHRPFRVAGREVDRWPGSANGPVAGMVISTSG